MMPKPILEAWRLFCDDVLSVLPDEHRGTTQNLKEVFFAGAMAINQVYQFMGQNPEAEGTVRLYMDIEKEFKEFLGRHQVQADICDDDGHTKLEDMTEPEIGTFMRSMADNLVDVGRCFGIERLDFVLLVFNDPKLAQYISNNTRETMIDALKETYERLSAKQDVERSGS